MVDLGRIIVSSIISSVVNIIAGIALTPVLADAGAQSYIPVLWTILLIGVPVEAFIILCFAKDL